jgi:Tol biopolymer transport system component/DNA-binding winged helix-turn-helix (wHTH) protein
VETPAETTRTWRFGVFEVDARNAELRRGGAPVKMREQSFRILVYLLEHAGEMVTREELRRVLWPSDTFVDFDHSLNTAVMKLRDALGDSADAPLYIETVPKRGYRFIAPVSLPETVQTGIASAGRDPSAAENHTPSNTPTNTTGQSRQVAGVGVEDAVRHRWPRRTAVVLGVVVLILLAAAGSMMILRVLHGSGRLLEGSPAASALQIVPVTTAPGEAVLPALSPDGREIAFLWNGPERRRYDLYLQLIGSDTPLQLTHSKGGLPGYPAWSPDGQQVAFSRCDGKNDGVFVVPALGGPERELTRVSCLYTLPGPVAWLSDGQKLLIVDHCSATGRFDVVLFSLATGTKECLTKSASLGEADGGFGFALSPDGKTLAFIRTTASLVGDIYTIGLSDGKLQRLTIASKLGCTLLSRFGCTGLMWTPDSKFIVFLSAHTTLPSLWRVSVKGGPIERETTYPAIGAISKDGRRFVYSEITAVEDPAIWQADLPAAGGRVLSNRKLISTQYPETDAQPSADGKHLVWMSIRTGSEEIWSSSATGENPSQLTHLNRYSGTPRWSPDGEWVAFDSYTGKNVQIFGVDAEGRNTHAITGGAYDNVVPSWSRDGKWIYFASKRTGNWELWKHSLESGAELQITRHGGFDAFESYDGQTIYFSKFDQAGIWSMPADGVPANGRPANGSEESLVIADKPQVGYWGHWAVTEDGLYLLNTDAEPGPTIEFYRFATRRVAPVLTLEMQPARQQPSLSATRDGKTIYYTQYDRQSVIKMMEFSR